MECPHCGKEMRKGRLSGGRDYVYWKDAGPDAELVRLTRFEIGRASCRERV